MPKAEGDRTRSGHWLRPRDSDDGAEVGYVELFFDLVFVFACTRLSLVLGQDLSAEGFARAALLLVAVWWVWVYTTLAANALDPDRTPVRLLMFALMLAGLVLTTSIPTAFGDRGLLFAGAYVAMQVGRSLFMIWAFRRAGHDGHRTYARMVAWLALSGAVWIAGGLLPGETRALVWALALALEILSPSLGFWVPGLGRSPPEDWDIVGPHIAERCALFVIIALGESMLVMGGTLDAHDWTGPRAAALVGALGASVAMWWIYFDAGAGRGERAMLMSDEPGRLAQVAYSTLHVPIVAGIVLAAVGDELTLAHPTEPAGRAGFATLGGPALFVLGSGLFKRAVGGRVPRSHVVGMALLGLGALLAWAAQPPLVVTSLAALAALLAVAVIEGRAVRDPGGPEAEGEGGVSEGPAAAGPPASSGS